MSWLDRSLEALTRFSRFRHAFFSTPCSLGTIRCVRMLLGAKERPVRTTKAWRDLLTRCPITSKLTLTFSFVDQRKVVWVRYEKAIEIGQTARFRFQVSGGTDRKKKNPI